MRLNVNWTQLGLSLVQVIPVLIGKIQKTKADAPGPQKQQDVIDLAVSTLRGTEIVTSALTGKEVDLIDEPEVVAAARAVIDAQVALKNAIANAKAKHLDGRTDPAPAPAPVE